MLTPSRRTVAATGRHLWSAQPTVRRPEPHCKWPEGRGAPPGMRAPKDAHCHSTHGAAVRSAGGSDRRYAASAGGGGGALDSGHGWERFQLQRGGGGSVPHFIITDEWSCQFSPFPKTPPFWGALLTPGPRTPDRPIQRAYSPEMSVSNRNPPVDMR